jgi:hypothetical protein
MKNKLFAFLLIFITTTLNAQQFSYGLVLGGDLFAAANNGGTSYFEPEKPFVLNYGGYVEYNFNHKWGIKTEATFHSKELQYRYLDDLGYGTEYYFKISFLEISPNLKCDFGQEYRKGFYMIFGPKFSFITKVTNEGEDVKDEFESPNIGLQWGIGQRIAKIADLQLKLDYEVSPFYKLNDNRKSNFFGMYVSLNFDLERIINKK